MNDRAAGMRWRRELSTIDGFCAEKSGNACSFIELHVDAVGR